MSLSNIVEFVAKHAPVLGTVLGGPIGSIAGIALNLVANLFGADHKNPDDILQKMIADPDAPIKLKQLELDHYAQEISDRDEARNLEEQYLKTTGHGNPMLPFLIILLFFAISGIIFCLIHFQIISDVKTILVMVLTALVREIPDIYHLYFGGKES